jgi:hypothetical protein
MPGLELEKYEIACASKQSNLHAMWRGNLPHEALPEPSRKNEMRFYK